MSDETFGRMGHGASDHRGLGVVVKIRFRDFNDAPERQRRKDDN